MPAVVDCSEFMSTDLDLNSFIILPGVHVGSKKQHMNFVHTHPEESRNKRRLCKNDGKCSDINCSFFHLKEGCEHMSHMCPHSAVYVPTSSYSASSPSQSPYSSQPSQPTSLSQPDALPSSSDELSQGSTPGSDYVQGFEMSRFDVSTPPPSKSSPSFSRKSPFGYSPPSAHGYGGRYHKDGGRQSTGLYTGRPSNGYPQRQLYDYQNPTQNYSSRYATVYG